MAYLFAAVACANPTDTLTEADYFSEQPVVLSASRLPQPVNRTPAAVTVITREMIEASGFRHLVDVLRLVPGFVVGWSGGNMPAATYLGLADPFPHWMQVMVDGRSVYNPAYGHITWRGIPLTLDDVDRIEVVRGPNAANDGLNSMLGTVHIYTRHSTMTLGGMSEVTAGDKNYKEANLRYGAETNKGSWRLGLLAREDERHGVAQDHATDLQLSFRGDFQPTRQDGLMLQLGISRNFWEGTNVGQLFFDDQHAYYLSGHANLLWKHALSENREWSLQAHHTFHQNKENILPSLSGDYRTSGSGIQFTYLDISASEWRTSLSGEYRLNRVYLPALLGTDEYLEDHIFRLSGGTEWSPSRDWVLHAAAMLEHHTDTDKLHLSPRLALNWLPSGEHSFRLGVSQGQSALGIYASNTDIKIINGGDIDQLNLSTSKLDAEKINSIELGYLLNKPEWGLNLDVRAYQNRIYDIVDTQAILVPFDTVDGKADTYINRPEVRQRGLEYHLQWRPSSRGWLILSQSWIDTDSAQETWWYPLSVPPYTLSLLTGTRIKGLDFSLGYYHTGNFIWDTGDDVNVSKYNRLDLRLAKSWKTSDGQIELILTLQGLLEGELEYMAEYLYKRQEFGRHGYLSLKYEF
ncbi:MAG: TonB-dependent receptor [Hydrogenophilaceae bacterium]|nr:TonB-dependent receptor [Hydrogenophilaceae bacterium]